MPSTCGVSSRNRCSIGGCECCAVCAVTGDFLSRISESQIRMTAQHLAHLDPHIARGTTAARRCRSPRGDLVRLLRALHVADTVSCDELFGLRDDSVTN